MNNLSAFNRFISGLKELEQVMPVLFIGHPFIRFKMTKKEAIREFLT